MSPRIPSTKREGCGCGVLGAPSPVLVSFLLAARLGLVFLSWGLECAGRGAHGPQCRAGSPSHGLELPFHLLALLLSRLLLLRSKMFQYVELWGREEEKNQDIVEKEIRNNPASSPHTPHVG